MKSLFSKRNLAVGVIVIMAIIIGCLIFAISRKDSYIKKVETINSNLVKENADQSTENETNISSSEDSEDVNVTPVNDNVTVTPQVLEEDTDSLEETTDSGNTELSENTDVIVAKEVDASFFETTKTDRDKKREESKERLMDIINSTDILEDTKKDAVDEMIRLNGIIEKETSSEMLLEAKGYQNPIVYIIDDKVDVVVNAESLSSNNIDEIKDVVKNKTDIGIENIIITPVTVKE